MQVPGLYHVGSPGDSLHIQLVRQGVHLALLKGTKVALNTPLSGLPPPLVLSWERSPSRAAGKPGSCTAWEVMGEVMHLFLSLLCLLPL